jgi:hypothetical protein
MKKILYTLIILIMIGTAAFAQESDAEGEQEALQMPPAGQVTTNMGTLKINGLVLAGAQAKGIYQEGWAKDGNWALEGINAVWMQNRADLYLDYSFMNYGAFLGLRAERFGPNSYDYGAIIPRYAFVYANAGWTKISVGKLYDELIPVQGSKLWKTTGPGDAHRFTDDGAYSIRIETKPVEGLNVGLQWFFPAIDGFRVDGNDGISGAYAKGLDETDAWKELGLGAQYSNSLFDAQLGVRFDSAVDRYNKLDTGPSGAGSYLIHYYGEAKLLAEQIPATASLASDMGDGIRLPRYKHWDKIVKTNLDISDPSDPKMTAEYLPYGDGHYAFFGFNFKGVENLTANAHGGLYNLGAFDKFGYGRFSEFIKYNITPKLGVGITMWQEFYGNDVFPDTMPDPRDTNLIDGQDTLPFHNSPFLRFAPQVSWAFITDPRMPLPVLSATLEGEIGLCANVLDSYARIKPSMTLFLGTFMLDLFYEMERTDYVDESLIKPMTTHTVGLAMMLLF